jgi:hypothetical protein
MWLKCDLPGFVGAVLVSQVAVRFHAQRPAVPMAQPARDGWDVHAGFDAARGEQVAQVVVGDLLSWRE